MALADAGAPEDPPGPRQIFRGLLRTHRSDPLHCGTLGSWFEAPAIPGSGSLLIVPRVIPAPLSVRPLGGNGRASLPGPCSPSPLSPLSPSPASAWVAMGGAGLQDPEACLWCRLQLCLAPGPPSFGSTADTSQVSRGCLIRRALVAHSWVWSFAVSGCSQEAGGRPGWQVGRP